MTTVSRDSETLAEGQQVITAAAFIHHNFDGIEKLFLAKRASTKKFLPGMFELSGGHIEFGEDIIEGLKREVAEEHHMRVAVGDPFAVFTYVNDIKGSHSIEVVYFAEFTDPIAQITINSEDHSEFRWVAENEIPNVPDITPEELKVIQKGFELLRGESPIFS